MYRLQAAIMALAICIAGMAPAATVGFSLVIDGNTDQPTFRLTNTGTTAQITAFSLTIGDTSMNFDRVFGNQLLAPAGGTMALTFGDTANNGLRTDLLSFAFTGFDLGEFAQFRAELDADNRNSNEDYRRVLFNNGLLPNAVASVGFSNGANLSLILPDGPVGSTSYSFAQSGRVAPPPPTVPLPASVILLAFGIAALGALRRRPVAA